MLRRGPRYRGPSWSASLASIRPSSKSAGRCSATSTCSAAAAASLPTSCPTRLPSAESSSASRLKFPTQNSKSPFLVMVYQQPTGNIQQVPQQVIHQGQQNPAAQLEQNTQKGAPPTYKA